MIRICVVVSILLYVSSADAIPRAGTCPNGTEWNVASGACVKKRAAPRMSGQDKFNRANEDIEGRGKNPDPKRGITLLEQACTSDNHAASCQLLGFMYMRGRAPVAKNDGKAADYFTKGCNLKDLESCVDVGALAVRKGDFGKARIAFQHGCDLGSGVACARDGDLLERGLGGAKDASTANGMYRRGMELLTKQCPATGLADGGACFYVGYLYEHGKGTGQDLPKAFAAFKTGCTAGHGQACLGLGRAHDKGYAGAADKEAANKAYDRGCTDFDNSDACQKIAERLGQAKQDLPRAFKLATRACELDSEYCGTLAEFYRLGLGIDKKDNVKATGHYKTACENGGNVWCINFAERAYNGVGMAKDVDAAVIAAERGCLGQDFSACGVGAKYLLEKKLDARALKVAITGCDESDGRSCFYRGAIEEGGRGIPKSETNALALYEKACKLEEPAACNALGRFHQAGLGGITKDPAKAFALYQQACEGKRRLFPDACATYAKMAIEGDGVARDPKLALKGYLRACEYHVAGACYQVWSLKAEAGAKREDILKVLDETCKEDHEQACFAKGDVLSQSETESDRRAGYEIFETACKRKVEVACIRQADMLANGMGVSKNVGRAEELYKAACDGGTSYACQGLGSLYFSTKKFEEAHVHFKRGCEAGLADSCMMVGWQLKNASGVGWDMAAGAKFYAKACEMGSRMGCNNLGALYRYGQGVPIDHKKARALFEGACRPGEATGCAGFGEYLWRGYGGTAIDKKRAEEMYRRSCSNKEDADPEGCSELADLLEENKGSNSEIARLRTLALQKSIELSAENPYQLYVLGKFHRAGVATIKDPVKSLDYFSKACEKFNALGCVEAGKALRLTRKKDDAEKARVYLERACAASMEEACNLSKAKGPTSVTKGKGCCSGQVAPDAQTGALLLLAVVVMFRPRRRRASR